MALDDINSSPSVLPDYELVMHDHNSKVRKPLPKKSYCWYCLFLAKNLTMRLRYSRSSIFLFYPSPTRHGHAQLAARYRAFRSTPVPGVQYPGPEMPYPAGLPCSGLWAALPQPHTPIQNTKWSKSLSDINFHSYWVPYRIIVEPKIIGKYE